MTVEVPTDYSWNLISVPVIVSDFRRVAVYPTATSSAFAYNGSSYILSETLKNRRGYWLKFPIKGSVNVSGGGISSDTFSVTTGWNLVGSISSDVPVLFITSNPPGLITSNFYEYYYGYYVTDTIKAGRGYWVKVNQAGTLTLSSLVNRHLSLGKIKIVPASELPPSPPELEIRNQKSEIPSEFALEQNFPNPFNPSTVIRYQLPVDSWVTLNVYNTLGEEIATLVDEMQVAGFRLFEWNAGSANSVLPSGVYLYQLRAGTFTQARKMLIMR